MAELLDEQVLVAFANTSAFTGFMLSALTAWGYFRHWWVLVKFVITVGQLYVGVFVLSALLADAVRAAEPGGSGPGLRLVVPTVLMCSAIAFQAWLSIAKPGKRTPWAGAAKPPTAPAWHFGVAAAVPVLDYLLGTFVLGKPLPALSLLVAIGYPIWRSARLRVEVQGRVRAVP